MIHITTQLLRSFSPIAIQRSDARDLTIERCYSIKDYMFVPELRLIPEGRNRFTLAASIPVPSASYTEGPTTRGAPDSHPVGAGVIACQLFLKFTRTKCPAQVRIVHQKIAGLKIPEGTTVTAFVMQDATLLGWSSIVHAGGGAMVPLQSSEPRRVPMFRAMAIASAAAPAPRPAMTPDLAQPIVIHASPAPQEFTGPEQSLVELGVIDPTQTGLHKANIQDALREMSYAIKQADIKSGPGISVASCRDSVVEHAS